MRGEVCVRDSIRWLLRCSRCGTVYGDSASRWRCDCGGVLDIEFAPLFHPDFLRDRSHDLWRYREALPVGTDVVTLGEPTTPLVPVEFGARTLLIKQEQLFPTGSYKDRGAAILMTHLRDLGVSHVVEDSSGNAGCAIAAYAAHAGIACDIYVPVGTSPAKTAQVEAYGASLHHVPGTREDTARAAQEAATGTTYASHVYNPWFLQGTKTFAYEVVEDLGWAAPDTIVVPAGNGTMLLGASIGFSELKRAGVIDRVPRIVAVQAAACAPLAAAFDRNLPDPAGVTVGDTAAEGIAVASPARGAQILATVRASGGCFVAVTEQEITDSLDMCCAHGWFIEPTSAAVIAGALRYAAHASPEERIVTAFTGHGLKAAVKIAHLLTHQERTTGTG